MQDSDLVQRASGFSGKSSSMTIMTGGGHLGPFNSRCCCNFPVPVLSLGPSARPVNALQLWDPANPDAAVKQAAPCGGPTSFVIGRADQGTLAGFELYLKTHFYRHRLGNVSDITFLTSP